MIKVQNLSYSYPQKDLYKKVSFTIEDNVHCALIGTNGTGKSTLLDLILHSEEYLYDGKIEIDNTGRIGYVSQFSQLDPK
ncbi:MAG: ATP-binding cassette domain-containing protein, partial [Lacrimispora sphenoides]